MAGQEAVRHERIDEVIESTQLRGIYELLDEFDFSTDETVARGRPALAEARLSAACGSRSPAEPAGARLAQLDDRQRRGRLELLAARQRDHLECRLDRLAVDLLDPVGARPAARAHRLDELGAREQEAGAVVDGVARRDRLAADRLVVAGPALALAVVVDGVAAP